MIDVRLSEHQKIILDGFDEISYREELMNYLDLRARNIKILITSRFSFVGGRMRFSVLYSVHLDKFTHEQVEERLRKAKSALSIE